MNAQFLTQQNYFQIMGFKENPLPQFNVASYKRPGSGLGGHKAFFWRLNNTASRERLGGKNRYGYDVLKMLSNYAVLSRGLSKIVVLVL